MRLLSVVVVLLFLLPVLAVAQMPTAAIDSSIRIPSKCFQKLQKEYTDANNSFTQHTLAYLQKMARREERMRSLLSAVDPNAANALFGNALRHYQQLIGKLLADSGHRNASFSGPYEPYADTLQGGLAFLQQHPQLLKASGATGIPSVIETRLGGAASALQSLQTKIQDAAGINIFIQSRETQISQYLASHASLQGLLGKPYSIMSRDAVYYTQLVQQYREMLNDPGQLALQALSLLSRMPAFQDFMKTHSQLGSLFHLPGNYATPQALNGLQTKAEVAQVVNAKVSAGGSAGAGGLQSDLQSAESQLDTYKDKLSKLGIGNGEAPMGNFKPNDQHNKTFLGRLQYGFNLQTTQNSYYFPTIVSLGLSLGYKLGHSNIVGVGASYGMGIGNGIRDISLTGQAVGLRSFLQIKIKGGFSAAGGLEYNYTTPFKNYQQLTQLQYWTKSGLVGVTKSIMAKSKIIKQTSLSLLWDFLSYQQVPRTQAFIFRVGYSF
jgi:hypothetical protein